MDQPTKLVPGPISESLLHRVYDSDYTMFPTPLTFEGLQAWTRGSPGTCVSFHAVTDADSGDVQSEPVAVIICLPLRRVYWENLICGSMKESKIEPSMFPHAGEEVEVGCHTFHIERLDVDTESGGYVHLTPLKRFTEKALEVVEAAAKKNAWKVCGFSGTNALASFPSFFQRCHGPKTQYSDSKLTSRS